MKVNKENSWNEILEDEFAKGYFMNLLEFVDAEYEKYTVYPPKELIFAAFEITHFDDVKVVILGQDPYHGPNQADGLCFSVMEGVKKPPSLVNIFKELNDDLGVPIPKSGNLMRWAEQGVLMLNSTLTVREGEPGKHQNRGWEKFTDAVIQKLSDHKDNLVFILWGSYAQKKGRIIDASRHRVLKAVHPSPRSVYRGFYGSKPFSKTNKFLKSIGKKPIEW